MWPLLWGSAGWKSNKPYSIIVVEVCSKHEELGNMRLSGDLFFCTDRLTLQSYGRSSKQWRYCRRNWNSSSDKRLHLNKLPWMQNRSKALVACGVGLPEALLIKKLTMPEKWWNPSWIVIARFGSPIDPLFFHIFLLFLSPPMTEPGSFLWWK